ncbi:hypothetical protein [Actinoplanes sp. NBRC 103695]|uniref:hypothetical protein n=1 Tax=Actinoplanes sp. NBRC 103695 TaxID=3032202 RepID=UPI0024A4E216|nr:hypothetical protein [Actinoplanes sp. NBRC 103695]GLY94143.1 hypothetical protein Acsp02_13990 [Actinoplanes sp. NBRC 103695]
MIAPKVVAQKAWHFAFNRAGEISERMVQGREEIYFGHQFTSKGAHPGSVPSEAVDVYAAALRKPATLRASFEYYRDDLTDAQQERRRRTPLAIPVLAIGGGASMATRSNNFCDHWQPI